MTYLYESLMTFLIYLHNIYLIFVLRNLETGPINVENNLKTPGKAMGCTTNIVLTHRFIKSVMRFITAASQPKQLELKQISENKLSNTA